MADNGQPGGDGDSAASAIEKDLRRAIVELELLPGTRLSEQEIATRRGVSRQPVREALIRLAESRLIEVRPRRGTVVARISAREVAEALFVRQSIELAVVARAAVSFDPWQRRRIDSVLALQEEAAARADHASLRAQDELFHRALAIGAGVGLAGPMIADLKRILDRVCNLTMQAEADTQRVVRDHRAIMAAIDRQDGPSAQQAMKTHLEGLLDDLPELEARHPALFV